MIALGAFVMPGLACPPEAKASAAKAEKVAAELANASGGVILVTPDGVAKVKNKSKNQDAAAAELQFFGEAPALEAMKAPRAARDSRPWRQWLRCLRCRRHLGRLRRLRDFRRAR